MTVIVALILWALCASGYDPAPELVGWLALVSAAVVIDACIISTDVTWAYKNNPSFRPTVRLMGVVLLLTALALAPWFLVW